jgi:TonB family protein
VALLAALAAHLGVLYWITRAAPQPMAGAYGRLLDAVNISMVNSKAFEARQDVVAPPAPAAADAIEAKEGTVESKSGPQQPEQKEEKREPEKRPEEPLPPEAVEAPSVVKPPQEQEKERREATISADVGGAVARGDALRAEKQIAPAAASPGVVREYDGYVQSVLAKANVKRGLGYGTVWVKLQISPDGEITSAKVIKSSSNKKLDDEALSEVRRLKFPRPPPGMTDRQRWYEFPVKSR